MIQKVYRAVANYLTSSEDVSEVKMTIKSNYAAMPVRDIRLRTRDLIITRLLTFRLFVVITFLIRVFRPTLF